MDITVIIPSYNTKDLTLRCLRSVELSLQDSLLRYEIIVVDNDSNDGSVAAIRKHFPMVHCIAKAKNIGYGRSNNEALKLARGSYTLLLNSDCVVRETGIDALHAFVTRTPRSFVGGKLYNEDGTEQFSCGPMYSLYVVSVMLFLFGDRLGITRYSPLAIQQVDWISGACVMGRTDDFRVLRGFDEAIFLYMEEIELFYRAKKEGFTVWFYPYASFIHTGSGSSATKLTPVSNIFRGLLYLYMKHYTNWQRVILRFFLRIKAILGMIIGTLLGRKGIINAYRDGYEIVKNYY